MKPIVTLTFNPAIDGASEAEVVRPTRKIRTMNERYDPGGGGINVARVIAELGRPALPIYLAGGATGAVLDDLVAIERALAGVRALGMKVITEPTPQARRAVVEDPDGRAVEITDSRPQDSSP